MLAFRCHQPGPGPLLSLDTVDEPTPGSTGILIDIIAAGLNHGDLAMARGTWHNAPRLPLTLGMEVAGVIRAVGSEVTRFQPGDRVLALTGHGGFAESIVVESESRVIRIPDTLDFETAAAFGVSYGTSWYALHTLAGLQAGETLVVLGAGSGAGLAAVNVGIMLGARVVACASSLAKLQHCADYGAHALINYAQPGHEQDFAQVTARGVHVVFDTVGGPAARLALEHTGFGTRYLVVGYSSGEAVHIPLKYTLVKGCSIIGVASRFLAAHDVSRARDNLCKLAEDIGAGRLRPLISRRYHLADAAEAVRHLQDRERVGKHIIQIRDTAAAPGHILAAGSELTHKEPSP